MPSNGHYIRIETDRSHQVPAWSAGPPPEPIEKPLRPIRFGLRTVLVAIILLSIPLAWFGWQMRIVNYRKAVLSEVLECGGSYTIDYVDLGGGVVGQLRVGPFYVQEAECLAGGFKPLHSGKPADGPSDFRRWLGDRKINVIILPRSAPANLVDAAGDVDEADVWQEP